MTTLHATPYNLDAAGFYFESLADYQTKAKNHLDRFSNLVEEFEIQFIDGEDAELFEVCGINQTNLETWFDEIAILNETDKVNLFYLVRVCSYDLSTALEKLDEPCISENTLLDAATDLFDECYLPSIPDQIRYYIDYEKFARDCELGGDIAEFEYTGKTYTCTNASAI